MRLYPSISVCQLLYKLHTSKNNPDPQNLEALPNSFREKIFNKIWEYAGRPPGADYGRFHVFESLPNLKKAIAEIVAEIFNGLDQDKKDLVASKVLDHAGWSLSEIYWGANHAFDNIPLLLKIMIDSKQEEISQAAQKIGIIDLASLNSDAEQGLEAALLAKNTLEWCVEKFGEEEYNERIRAAVQILNCFFQESDWLYLSGFQITSLPEGLSLPNLKNLFLNDTQITSLPERLNLPKLKNLFLHRSQISSLSESMNFPSLKGLFLSNTKLTSLPESMILPKLKRLGLSDNPNLQKLPMSLCSCDNLVRIDADNTNIPQSIIDQILETCQRNRGDEAGALRLCRSIPIFEA